MTKTPTTSLAALLLALPALAQGNALTPMQVMRTRSVTHVIASPDGTTLAYTVSVPRGPDDEPGPARTHLYTIAVDGGEPRLVIGGERSASGVAFRPGSGLLTFLKQGDGDEHREVFGVPVGGGDERRITETPHGVGSYRWRPDGSAIAYSVEDPPPAGRARARAAGFEQRIQDEDQDHVSLWIWDAETGRNRKLTQGVTVRSFEWEPNGKHLAAGIARRNLVDDSYMFVRLHYVEPATGKVEPLVANPGKLGHYAWSPDGRTLAYISAVDRRDPHAGTMFTIRLGDAEPNALMPKLRGMVHQVEWLDETSIAFVVSSGVASSVMRMAVDSDMARSLAPIHRVAYRGISMLPGGRFATAASTPRHPAEVMVFDGVRNFTRLTDLNPWLADVALGEQELVRYRARDGLDIEGILMRPVGYREGTRYPLVVIVHGGPESHHSNGWLTGYSAPGQVLAGRGFFAWYPNYRSSTGYGVEFAKQDHGDPMGREFDDHIDAIEHLDALGLIDRKRVGIIGGSYGGYTAAWAATRGTEHFAAAVSFVPFVDIRTKWYTTDIPWEFYYVHYEEKWPHEQAGFLADRSPLTWAPGCRTPLLLLGGTRDTRVHPSQPAMLYRAVKTSTDTPVRYVRYPDEGHGNRTNVYRYDYLLRSLRWLERYLERSDARDLAPPPIDLDYGEWIRRG